jgi:hypothetical protein
LKIHQARERERFCKRVLSVADVERYSIQSIDNNEEQSDVVYSVLESLKKWIHFPEDHKKNSNIVYNPLFMTVTGAGGCGKTHVIHVLVNAIEEIFPDVKVSIKVAPTGSAAFNIFGKTLHSTFALNIKSAKKLPSNSQQKRLREDLQESLLLICDEMSLVSFDHLFGIERNCKNYALGGVNNEKPFGGIPIVMLFGDHNQLPSIAKGALNVYNPDGTNNMNGTLEQIKGREVLRTLATTVKELKTSQRLDQGTKTFKDILSTLRETGLLSDVQYNVLKSIDVQNVSSERAKFLEDKAMWLFTTKHECADHNIRMLREKNKDHPVAKMQRVSRSSVNPEKGITKSHFDDDLHDLTEGICVSARVALTRPNLKPDWGLYNGAIGTVISIIYRKGECPNKINPSTKTIFLPQYVVVEFDSYKGPVWNVHKPKQVPIAPKTKYCTKGHCCMVTYIPLRLAFSRTLHTFQGQEAGPGKDIPAIVLHAGARTFEGKCPGLLYTGLSRAANIGNGDIEKSALYLIKPGSDEKRYKDIVHKARSNKSNKEIYERVRTRRCWQNYLKKNIRKKTFTMDEKKELTEWSKTTKIGKGELHQIIHFHNNH